MNSTLREYHYVGMLLFSGLYYSNIGECDTLPHSFIYTRGLVHVTYGHHSMHT